MRVINDRPLSGEKLAEVDTWWRAANYVSVGQIYLLANPLLREPLRADHVKPRLLGHWGTTPGLNLIQAHLNRVISEQDLDCIYVFGPGHGGPAAVAGSCRLDRLDVVADLQPQTPRSSLDRRSSRSALPRPLHPSAGPESRLGSEAHRPGALLSGPHRRAKAWAVSVLPRTLNL